MPPKKQPPPVQQTATGNDNIQVIGSHNVITRITNFFAGDTEAQRAMRNRRAMLELVKNTWIKGVLEKSLYNEVLIELGMEERPSAVGHPWDMQVQMPDKPNRTLPPGTSMMEMFDAMNGAMLILGEPGSGKTTMLLELARDGIDRAQQDDNQPIPVVFNLSSWISKQTIDDWLVDELRTKYNVPNKIAKGWVENSDLQLLFDGLDEVRQENREICVRAINAFRQKHGLTTPIAVCSRIADYEALTAKMSLQGAVLLQPLTPEQIDEYFEQAGSELEAVHQILKNDETLQELVKQPLILSIMILAYQGKSVEAFANESLDTIGTRRKHLFDTYIQQMFERVARTKYQLYTPKQTKHWLTWLANSMIDHKLSMFLLDQMDRDWLQTQGQQKEYKVMVQLVGGMVFGLVFALVGGSTDGGLLGGLLVGLLFGIMFSFFLVSTALTPNLPNRFHLLKWSWRRGMLGSVLAVLCFGLIGMVGGAPSVGPLRAFLGGVPVGLLLGLLAGVSGAELKTRSFPAQVIRQYMKNAIVVWLVVWLVSGLAVELFFGLPSGLKFGEQGGLIGGAIIGFLAGLVFGGGAVILHYSLRLIFYRIGHMPLNYIRFLDYCVDRIFLRRVGGGYIFVHRLLMEHFADMYPADEK